MCTRILWNNNKLAVFAGRSMDWPISTEPKLTIFPRGQFRHGGRLGETEIVTERPTEWTSKYASLVTTIYGLGAADGINECGLTVHMLYLTTTDFGERDTTRSGVHAGLWAQLLLDQAASVKEALALLQKIQPVMLEFQGMRTTVHLAIEDTTGDSAIIEYVGGKQVVHHGKEFQIMTNDPPYDEQLAHLAQFDFTGATRETPLPGNVSPKDRFIRAFYYLKALPEPKSEREAIASILAIARNVSVPFGAPNKKPGSLYNTEYRTATDLTHGWYFFELTTAPNVIWTKLANFSLDPGAPVMALDPNDITLSGDVTGHFQKIPSPY
ncbi:MAG: linear amide C-N hydrolase [Chthoniobacterales bacterium]